MSSPKPALDNEANCPIDGQNGTDLSEEETPPIETGDNEEEITVRKMLIKRHGSPSITVNRNGSRYIPPIEIVRSEAGRAEILRQRSQGEHAQQQDKSQEQKPAIDPENQGETNKVAPHPVPTGSAKSRNRENNTMTI